MLTKIIVLSDVYGLTFDIDQAELINNQRLIANIFKLIKKTQMVLPARSPRRRSLANISSATLKNRRSKSPDKREIKEDAKSKANANGKEKEKEKDKEKEEKEKVPTATLR
eukprot:TRINITY_DN8867_c0_g1_i1.p1 TRINITY_DN8867_c0_g1~~TRINITY_DN8867_c0_g1_i1.p1  ORF type:complete len:111 (+),score=32.97 TRINITY_DN8867_c0_g1_i1:159-491(+)